MNGLLHILMIDDNKNDVVLVEQILKSNGMQVVVKQVDDAITMKEIIKNKKPDVILVDSAGILFDAKNILKKQKWNFIAYCGTDNVENRKGAIAFVNKNDYQTLPKTIKAVLKMSREEDKIAEEVKNISKKCDVIISKLKKRRVM
jgi:DNA-binding NtrC family response regulator